jgi:F0F1-type ATP synthase assembly protein I
VTASHMILLATTAAVKIGILVVATVVFLAVYGWLLDHLERRGP